MKKTETYIEKRDKIYIEIYINIKYIFRKNFI